MFSNNQGFVPAEQYAQMVEALPILTMDINVLSANGQILQVQRRDEPLAGEWWTPGGRIRKGEDMVPACHRILKQELGIAPELVKLIQFKGVLPFKHYKSAWGTDAHTVSLVLDVLLAEDFKDEMIRLDETSLAWRWAHILDKHPKWEVIRTFTNLKGGE